MIEFEKKTWYDKNDMPNQSKRIPISAAHLNRIEGALSDTVRQSNNMTNHWWRKSKVVDGYTEIPRYATSQSFYVWNNTYETTTIYYSSSVTIKVDDSTGELYVELDNPSSWVFSYNNLGSGINNTLIQKYFIIEGTSTKNGLDLYYNGGVNRSDGVTTVPRFGFYISSFYHVTLHKVYGNVEYVNSADREAYIDGWDTANVVMYEYLGVPFENSREPSCGITTGWYFGDGTYSRMIKIEHKPKCVVVYMENDSGFPEPRGIASEDYSCNISISDGGFVITYPSDTNATQRKYYYTVFY